MMWRLEEMRDRLDARGDFIDSKDTTDALDGLVELRLRLVRAMEDARGVYERNKASGSSALSIAYDSGRIDGLKQSLEIFDELMD